MKEELISFETAKLAKEKGFVGCRKRYCSDSVATELHSLPFNELTKDIPTLYPAPTQSLLQKWLRDEKSINIEVTHYHNKQEPEKWSYDVTSIPIGSGYYLTHDLDNPFKTYEEALEKGLQEALKMLD